MSKYDDTTDDDFDDFEFSETADAEQEPEDGASVVRRATPADGKAAWQRIEQRRESAWLRDQLTDWDDWDVGIEAAVLR